MINDQLRAIIDRALDRERISVEDVRELQREVFEHGLTCREEVNVLAALDRAVPNADPSWAEFFIASLVEFVVWTSRPTGYVDNETARWLITVLMPMDRATGNAHRAGLEIIREAQQVDEEILLLLLLPGEVVPSVPVPVHLAVSSAAPQLHRARPEPPLVSSTSDNERVARAQARARRWRPAGSGMAGCGGGYLPRSPRMICADPPRMRNRQLS